MVDNLQPFFFGSADKQLYGTYQPGEGVTRRKYGVVLCYPLGDEYIRAHRAYRQWAMRLTRLGFPVLRFDYYGTGDSAGDDVNVSLAEWQADIGLAIDELKRRSGVTQICLAGLRLGASLALLAGLKRPDVNAVVLWEPIVNGAAYLDELREAHESKLMYLHSKEGVVKEENKSEFLGFKVSDTFMNDLRGLDLLALQDGFKGKLYIIEGEAKPPVAQLKSKLEGQGSNVVYQQAEGPTIWVEDPDKALVPNAVLQAMVTWMGEGLV